MHRIFIAALLSASLAFADDARDFVYLGPEPVFLRIHVRLDGQDYHTPFREWLRREFDKADADNDGYLVDAEAHVLLDVDRDFGSAESIPASRKHPVRHDPDPNGDGRFDFDEFVKVIETSSGPALEVRTTVESAALRFRGGPLLQDGQRVFRHLDADGDRRLTPLEIRRAPDAFRKLDQDDDDTVSLQEVSSSTAIAVDPPPPTRYAGHRQQLPLLELDWGHVSEFVERSLSTRFIEHYDGNPVPDRVLSPAELRIAPEVFTAHDGNCDGVLDVGEVLTFLKNAAPAFEVTLYVSDKWERTPAIDVVCHDARLKDRVQRAFTGDVMLDLGDLRLELSVLSSHQFDSLQVLEEQFQRADVDKNGYLDEMERWKSRFIGQMVTRADKDQDDKLFLKELRLYVESKQQAGLARTVIDLTGAGRSLFEVLDVNRDRRLNASEIAPRGLDARVKTWDADGDGALAEPELPHYIRLTARRGTAKITALNGRVPESAPDNVRPNPSGPPWFANMDRNRDGELSKREFLGAPDVFSRLDRDANGVLDPDEAQPAKN